MYSIVMYIELEQITKKKKEGSSSSPIALVHQGRGGGGKQLVNYSSKL